MGEELLHCCRIPFRMLILKCFRPLAISKCSFGQFYWQHLHLQDIINWITCKRLKRTLIVSSGDESWKVCNFLDEKLGCLGIGLTANKASISWAVKSRQWTVLPREIITRNFLEEIITRNFFSVNLQQKLHSVQVAFYSLINNNKRSSVSFSLSKTKPAFCNLLLQSWQVIQDLNKNNRDKSVSAQ